MHEVRFKIQNPRFKILLNTKITKQFNANDNDDIARSAFQDSRFKIT